MVVEGKYTLVISTLESIQISTYNVVYWSLYNVINQCDLNKLIKKKKWGHLSYLSSGHHQCNSKVRWGNGHEKHFDN